MVPLVGGKVGNPQQMTRSTMALGSGEAITLSASTG